MNASYYGSAPQEYELYHYGVKGMKWGVRKKYKQAAQAHEAKTRARDEARRQKVSDGIKKYKQAAQAHEAKTRARDEARRQKVSDGINKFAKKNRTRPERLDPLKSDSATTRRVKKDYNELSDQAFMNKYSVSKDRYAARVAKYGDPAKKAKSRQETTRKIVQKGADTAGKLLTASLMDDIFYGGAGKRALKEGIKQTGRAAVTAYMMARGAWDIRWYDN